MQNTPIAELMARNPLELTDQNIDAIIADLCQSRSRFVLADDRKIGTPPSRKSQAQKDREARAQALDVNIDDLFKDL